MKFKTAFIEHQVLENTVLTSRSNATWFQGKWKQK